MIESVSNPKVKHLVLLREKSRARNREGLFPVEGIKMFAEAPYERIREVYVSASLWRQMEGALGGHKAAQGGNPKAQAGTGNAMPGGQSGMAPAPAHALVWEKLLTCMERGIYVEQVSDEVLRKAADTQTPQGILFVMEQFSYTLEEMLQNASGRQQRDGKPPLFLLLEDIQDPGNLGTMLRTGEGAGVSGVIMSRKTADIYNPKTIRSTMGSLYRVPFWYVDELSEAITLLKDNGIKVYAAHLKGERYFDEISYSGGSAFLVGNEGNGLKTETAGMADVWLKIPMEGKLESLNAAVSAALLLYRAAGEWRSRSCRGD